MSFTKVAPAGIGTEPGNSILIGDSLLHSTGIDIGSNTGAGVTIRQHGDATFTGIITASAFFGDGSGLEGVSSSGIGTPLSDDDTSDLNKIYYANQELVIDSTVTVNHPDTGIAAYTHYQDLVVKDNADFIVADGDTFIPDVLGINTSSLPNPVSSATGGRIRAGTLTNAGANGAPNFPNGVTGTAATFTTGTFTGVINAASGTITGNLGVGGVLTYEDVTNVDSIGVITARSNLKVGGTIEMTNGTTSINKHSVGIGTTTTAGRNAGVSTATGTIIYNASSSKVQLYVGNEWKNLKIDVGPLTMNYLVIGGGGAGGGDYRGGGGGAGAYRTNWNNENQGGGQSSGDALVLLVGLPYSIVVGAGGVGNSADQGGDGVQSKFDTIIADGGGGGGHYNGIAGRNSPGNGSGGGGGSANGSAGSSGTYGYNGGVGGSVQCGGGGGGAASAGIDGGSGGTNGDGGSALASTITGSSVLRAGGGGGGSYGSGNNVPVGGGGGAGDGKFGYSGANNGNPATANTGSGGGGAPGNETATGGAGGSGVVILRYPSVFTAAYSAGVTKTTSTIGSETIDIITATSNTSQTVTFAD